ncbi:MAG: STT3 domain-containing protein [archaeon]
MAHHSKTDTEKFAQNNFGGKLLQKIYENRKMIIILLAIFLLAFTIRAHLMRYDQIFEFDSYYHLRIVGELVQNGQLPARDPLAYYQEGGSTLPGFTLLWPIAAAFYAIIGFGQPFSKDILLLCAKILPALFGALIAIAMYWLGKEIYNKKAGVAMAFIAATVPAFVYRTMAGFFEDDSLGFLWMVIGFVFMLRATKSEKITKQSILNSILAGIFFSAMALTWSLYLLIPLVITPYFIVSILIIATKGGTKERITAFIANFGAGYIIFNALILLIGGNWIQNGINYIAAFTPDVLDPFIWIGIAVISIGSILFAYWLQKTSEENKKIATIVFVSLLWVSLLITLMLFLVVHDLTNRSSISSMVGEESVGLNSFGQKFNSLIILPILALILLPASILFARDKKHFSHGALIIFFWVLITLIMAYYKLKFTYSFGLPIAAAAGFITYFVFDWLERSDSIKRIEAKVVVISLFFVLLLGVGAVARFVPDYVPTLDSDPDWKEAANWISDNTSEDAKLFNWWNQGHILSFITGRKVSTDNRNYSFCANYAMAKFVDTDNTALAYKIASTQNEILPTYSTCENYSVGADYIVLDTSMFQTEPQFYFYTIGKIDYSDANYARYGNAPINVLSCSADGENMNCGGNTLPKTEFDKFPETWTSTPAQFYNGKEPLYIYKYQSALVVLNQTVNNSNLAKVWFNSDETKNNYTEVFANTSVKIFKIIK